jgi:hypothetical protein
MEQGDVVEQGAVMIPGSEVVAEAREWLGTIKPPSRVWGRTAWALYAA